jgi:hypothetical protein
MTNHMRRRAFATLAAAVLAGSVVTSVASGAAAAPTVCPDSDGWVKVDLVEDGVTSVHVTAPEGMLIAATCVKAGRTVDQVSLDVPVPVVDLVSPGTNRKGVMQAVSHYAVLLVPDDGGPVAN